MGHHYRTLSYQGSGIIVEEKAERLQELEEVSDYKEMVFS